MEIFRKYVKIVMNFTLSTFEINKLPFLFFLKNKYLLCRMRYSKLELLNKKKYFTKKNNSLLTFLIFNKNLIDFKSYIDNFYEKIKNFSLETIEIFFFDFNSGTDFTYFFKSGYDNLKIIIFDKNYNSNIFFIYFNFLNEINGQYIFFADTKIEIIDIDLLNILKNFSNNDLEIIYFKINNKYFKFKFINYIPEFNIKEKKIELNINYNKNDLILPIYNFFLGRKNTINLWLKERLSAFIVNLNNFEIEQILLNNKYQKEIKKIFNIFFKSENEFFNKFDLVLFIKIQNKKIFYYENLQIFDSNYP
ncbi:MAG: hypothetical protein N3A58_06700, partial [Spirochaetes bacterium]|nr:hypothetical protein [Spirochaetota bacterium]